MATQRPDVPLELVDQIFRFLDRNTLSSCSMVHTSWSPFARALLWSTISLRASQLEDQIRAHLLFHSENTFAFTPDFGQFVNLIRASPSLASLVRILRIRGVATRPADEPNDDGISPSIPTVFELNHLLDITQALPRLVQLELHDVSARHEGTLPAITVPLSCLMYSQFSRITDNSAWDILLFMTVFDAEHVDVVVCRQRMFSSLNLIASPSQYKNRRTRSLKLSCLTPGLRNITDIVCQTPMLDNIEHLHIYLRFPGDGAALSALLQVVGPKLSSLKLNALEMHGLSSDLGGVDEYTEHGIILEGCKTLQRLEIFAPNARTYSSQADRMLLVAICHTLASVSPCLRELHMWLTLRSLEAQTIKEVEQELRLLDDILSSLLNLRSITLVVTKPFPFLAATAEPGSSDAFMACFPKIKKNLKVQFGAL